MMWQAIENGMWEAQRKQDAEGALHPGQTQVYTFTCPPLLRWWLKLKRVKGLDFERYNGEWYGVFRARK